MRAGLFQRDSARRSLPCGEYSSVTEARLPPEQQQSQALEAIGADWERALQRLQRLVES